MEKHRKNRLLPCEILLSLLLIPLIVAFIAMISGNGEKLNDAISSIFTDDNSVVEEIKPEKPNSVVSKYYTISDSIDFSTNDGFTYRKSSLSQGNVVLSDGVFNYEKTSAGSGTGESIVFLPYGEEVKAGRVIATFDIYLDSSVKTNSPMSYQLAFNENAKTPFIATIRTANNGFSFGSMKRNVGNDVFTDETTVLEYDTWHTIKLEVNMLSKEEFNVVFYANGKEIGTSNVFNETNVSELKTEVKGFYLFANSSVVSSIKLDDVSLYTLVYKK